MPVGGPGAAPQTNVVRLDDGRRYSTRDIRTPLIRLAVAVAISIPLIAGAFMLGQSTRITEEDAARHEHSTVAALTKRHKQKTHNLLVRQEKKLKKSSTNAQRSVLRRPIKPVRMPATPLVIQLDTAAATTKVVPTGSTQESISELAWRILTTADAALRRGRDRVDYSQSCKASEARVVGGHRYAMLDRQGCDFDVRHVVAA